MTGGAQVALEQASAAAAGAHLQIGGGGQVIQQYLRLGVVDELTVSVVPMFLGGGTRLFDRLEGVASLEPVGTIEARGVTHLRYRRISLDVWAATIRASVGRRRHSVARFARALLSAPDGRIPSGLVSMRRAFDNTIDPGWARALTPVAPQIAAMGDFLRAERRAGRSFLPSGDRVLRAFTLPLSDVRVLIVGQDPYPTPGHAVGLSFSVAPDVRPLPPSLVNIFREYRDDLGLPEPRTGDLSPWAERGVLLLNRSLTVARGAPNSHQGRGWEAVTEQAIRALAARGGPLVAILWGRNARNLRPLLGAVPCIESAHPSPLSARGGFFGSRPFSRANELLEQQGGAPVDWRLP